MSLEATSDFKSKILKGGHALDVLVAQLHAFAVDYHRQIRGKVKLFPNDQLEMETKMDEIIGAIATLSPKAKKFFNEVLQRASFKAYEEK